VPPTTALGAADRGDDEPSFDVEPLQPFVQLDPLPTGWAAFDLALADALIRNGNTAASVAVAIGGEIVHRSAFGERAPGDAAEPVDRFRIASISKTLTALTLLQLVEGGVVGLDEPIGARVAAHVGVSDPSAATAAVTVRQLLHHTAGYGKFQSVFFGGQAASCEEAARIGLSRSPSSPGSYNYSNMGYCVAGQLIETLTGHDYDDAVYEQVLAPLGISGPRLAATFDPGPDEVLHPTTLGRNYMEALGPAGGWIATPADLVRVLDALDPSTPGYKPLEAVTLEQMKTPVGGQRGQRGYGLGLLLYGGERYGHTGTIESTHAMTMNRGDGVTWAITVSGPYPDDTPQLESIINRAFAAGGFVAG
jgi:D-alanyl-D-alanine carboxypeptidase